MSVRRKTTNRLSLIRTCGTCGKTFPTTADTPFMRQLSRDGKKQATTYFCSSTCFQKSYKHIGWYDGKAQQRKLERDRARDPAKEAARCRAYYAAHREECCARQRERYWSDPDRYRKDSQYSKQKRKIRNEIHDTRPDARAE